MGLLQICCATLENFHTCYVTNLSRQVEGSAAAVRNMFLGGKGLELMVEDVVSLAIAPRGFEITCVRGLSFIQCRSGMLVLHAWKMTMV